MIKKNFIAFLVIILFSSTIYGLFTIKSKVTMLKSELVETQRQIKLEKDSIRILKAEMAYLSSPQRLSKLNEGYLKLQGTESCQLIKDPLAAETSGKSDRIIGVDSSPKNRIIIDQSKSVSSRDIIKTGYSQEQDKALSANSHKQKQVKWRYKSKPR